MHYTADAYCRMEKVLFTDPALQERITLLKTLEKQGIPLALEDQQGWKRGLNIGSVMGLYEAFFLHLGMTAVAVNKDPTALRYLRENAFHSPYIENGLGKNVILVQGDICELPVRSETIDVVTVMTGTFSHVPAGKHYSALEECARVLTTEVVLVISDWNFACERQDLFGLYSKEEAEELRRNHLGYPHLLGALEKDFTVRRAYLHCGKRMYLVLATKK